MLKIIWFSTVPYSSAGYGNATREILRRFRADGNEVVIFAKHPLGGTVVVDGVTCYDGGNKELINKIKDEHGYDYIVTMFDDWVLPDTFSFKNWVSCSFLDTHKIYPKHLRTAKRAPHVIAMTKFTKNELESNGKSCFYAPLGVNTTTFAPDPEKRKLFREQRGWGDDKFIIGSLGLNYSSDRKNFVNTIRAFATFHKTHPDSILYLHTDIIGSHIQGTDLQWVINDLGFPTDGTGAIQYVEQAPYHLWNLSEEAIIRAYNAFDVFCFPTMGEGFGMPIVEAQACGVPVIVTDTTSGKELLKGGWLIECTNGDMEYSTQRTWIMRASEERIIPKLEEAYSEWKRGAIKTRQIQAREGVLEYDWDYVYKTHWKPIFDYLDLEKQGKTFSISTYPNYIDLYNEFGVVLQVRNCEAFEHDRVCMTKNFPKLLGEPENDPRGMLIRSYPIFPNSKGEFYVDKTCPFHSCLPPRFIKECKDKWAEVLSYPKLRTQIEEYWTNLVKNNSNYIKLEDIPTESFDEHYATVFQKLISSAFSITPNIKEFISDCKTFVDVGCGKGEQIKLIQEAMPNSTVKGIEFNKHWANNDNILLGDIMNLPLKDNEVDCAFCLDVLEHLEDPLKAIKELLRVVSKKAVIVVTALDSKFFEEDPTHKVRWTFEQWKRELNEFCDIYAIDISLKVTSLLVKKRQEA